MTLQGSLKYGPEARANSGNVSDAGLEYHKYNIHRICAHRVQGHWCFTIFYIEKLVWRFEQPRCFRS